MLKHRNATFYLPNILVPGGHITRFVPYSDSSSINQYIFFFLVFLTKQTAKTINGIFIELLINT